MPSDITITDAFPTGNIIVDRLDGNEAWIRQDQRGSTKPWFYWHFAVHDARGRTMTYHFTDWDVVGRRGPAVSLDRGASWTWLGRDDRDSKLPSFTYTFPDDAEEVRFCFCIPYAEAELRAFLQGRPAVQQDTLCLTPRGRRVDRLRVGDRSLARRVLVTARHHACESSASFVLEGLIDRWLAAPAPPAALVAVPFVDKDGVEQGDQGKARNGHDHHRDYTIRSRYNETTAIMAMVQDWPEPPVVTMDLHCPWIRGKWNERAYVVGSRNPEMAVKQRQFVELLSRRSDGPLPFKSDDYLPYGQAWNTSEPSPDALSFSKWMTQQGAGLVLSFEMPYAQVQGVDVTPERLRRFGEVLGGALLEWLEG